MQDARDRYRGGPTKLNDGSGQDANGPTRRARSGEGNSRKCRSARNRRRSGGFSTDFKIRHRQQLVRVFYHLHSYKDEGTGASRPTVLELGSRKPRDFRSRLSRRGLRLCLLLPGDLDDRRLPRQNSTMRIEKQTKFFTQGRAALPLLTIQIESPLFPFI